MKNFEAAKELFKDSVDPFFYFDSINAEIARTKLQEAIGDISLPLIFIVGEPGVGKSQMLHVMHQATALRATTVLIDHPFFNANDILKALYTRAGLHYDSSKDDVSCFAELIEAYESRLCTLFIDEAQLLNDEQFEMIRLLSDTNVFQFVLAIHTKEAMQLLKKPSFKTRKKLVLEYGNLEENEVLRYIQSLLMNQMLGDIALMFSKNDAKVIARYAKGNFRTIKRFLYTLMKLLDYAQVNHLSKYQNINSCLLTMAALDIGLIRD